MKFNFEQYKKPKRFLISVLVQEKTYNKVISLARENETSKCNICSKIIETVLNEQKQEPK